MRILFVACAIFGYLSFREGLYATTFAVYSVGCGIAGILVLIVNILTQIANLQLENQKQLTKLIANAKKKKTEKTNNDMVLDEHKRMNEVSMQADCEQSNKRRRGNTNSL